MKCRTIVGLLLVIIAFSCIQQPSKNGQQFEDGPIQQPLKSGLQIEYGPNLGADHTDTFGTRHFYVHSTAIITNDSTIPIHLKLALSNEHEYPTYCGDTHKYKVFLLPEELTPDTATIYNNIVNGQHDFLNAPIDNSKILHKTLNSGEYCVVSIGVLVQKPTNCAAVPRAIFSYDNKGLYHACDSQINRALSTSAQLEIGVKLEYYNRRKFIAPEDGCTIIPFGQISYPEH